MNDQKKRRTVFIMRLHSDIDCQTYRDLKFLYEHSDKAIRLTDNPNEADLILIALPGNDTPFHTFAKSFIKLKLPTSQLDKAFVVSLRRAKHIFLMRGVYESAGNYGMGKSSRIKAGAFTEKAFNSLIECAPTASSKNPTHKKNYLFSFIGRNCHSVRQKIFHLTPEKADVLIEVQPLPPRLRSKQYSPV